MVFIVCHILLRFSSLFLCSILRYSLIHKFIHLSFISWTLFLLWKLKVNPCWYTTQTCKRFWLFLKSFSSSLNYSILFRRFFFRLFSVLFYLFFYIIKPTAGIWLVYFLISSVFFFLFAFISLSLWTCSIQLCCYIVCSPKLDQFYLHLFVHFVFFSALCSISHPSQVHFKLNKRKWNWEKGNQREREKEKKNKKNWTKNKTNWNNANAFEWSGCVFFSCFFCFFLLISIVVVWFGRDYRHFYAIHALFRLHVSWSCFVCRLHSSCTISFAFVFSFGFGFITRVIQA